MTIGGEYLILCFSLWLNEVHRFVCDENDERRTGFVPATFVAFADEDGNPIQEDEDDEKKEKKEDRVKARIKENMKRANIEAKQRKSTTIVKQADKARDINLPKGCSESVLSTFRQNEDKVLSATLRPTVNSSGSGFTNLSMDPATKRLRSCPVQCTIGFSLIEAKNIEPLIGDRRVLGRHVRMALFDNTDILSNVHSIPAIHMREVPNLWKFSSKASLLFPKDDENTCFLRTNDVDIKLCILFELCALVEMSEVKNKTDIIEVSVGWGMLPLFTSDGTAIENKSYDIRLYSGSPYSKEAFAKEFTEKKSFFQTLIHGNKHPRLNIKVWKLGQGILDEINQLPESICSFLSAVPVMAKYRQIMCDTLIRDKNYGPRQDPALAVFPTICNQSDLLHLLSIIWERKTKSVSQKKMKNSKLQVHLKQKFGECVMLVWPILHMHEFPAYIEGHEKVSASRMAFANNIQELGMIELLGKNRDQYGIAPFDMAELASNFP
ncbi:Nephrocystin-1 [Rhizoclosmatium hyalinum]|nr:Nephrocystin-1 [Rhizoclosmatium hyalinum]